MLKLPATLFPIMAIMAWSHPIPDIPVIGHFFRDGTMTIEVEIDPRCFENDPEKVPYMLKPSLEKIDPSKRQILVQQARELAADSFRCRFVPRDWFDPEFSFTFGKMGGGKLEQPEDKVVLQGHWQTKILPDMTGYQVHADPDTGLAIVFTNRIDGVAQKEVHVLFPDEESFILELKRAQAEGVSAPKETSETLTRGKGRGGYWITFSSFLRQGFVHVIPKGVDHILFVLGLFLLSRKWKPLLLQVSTFTVAHTITLGLATLGLLTVKTQIVEVVIALSITAIALQNIFQPKYNHSRLYIIFILGLVHGLGFAGALSELGLQPTALATGLIGFNIGVEFGQIAILIPAYYGTKVIQDQEQYRKWIVVPASLVIATVGLYWAFERLGVF